MQEIRENGDRDDEILIIQQADPDVVHPPTDLQGQPWQSRFIFNPNQPPPPVLATRFFPPPPWPENLEGDNLTIEPVVGPMLSLTPEEMDLVERVALESVRAGMCQDQEDAITLDESLVAEYGWDDAQDEKRISDR